MSSTESDFILNWKAIWLIYREAARKSTRALWRNWFMPLASIAAYLVFLFSRVLLSYFPGGGGAFSVQGLILGLIVTALLTLYYGWLEACVLQEKVSFASLMQFDRALFLRIIGVGFILWVADLFINMFIGAPQFTAMRSAISFGIFIGFNSVCETIYLQRRDGLDALREALNFIRENSIEWFIPLLILFLPVMSLVGSSFVILLAQGDPLLPPLVFLNAIAFSLGETFRISFYLLIAIAVTIVTWFMIFRGNLHRELSSSSKRKRLFRMRA